MNDADAKNHGFALTYGASQELPPEEAPLLAGSGTPYRYPDRLEVKIACRLDPGSGEVFLSPRPLFPSGGSPRLFACAPAADPAWTAAQLWEVLRTHAEFFDAGFAHGQQALARQVRDIVEEAARPPIFREVVVDEWNSPKRVSFTLSTGDRYDFALVGPWERDKIEAVCRTVIPRAFDAGITSGREALGTKLLAVLDPHEAPPGILDRMLKPVVDAGLSEAVALFGAKDDGLFNLACFQTSTAKLLNLPDGLGSDDARTLLARRQDVEPMGRSHYRWKEFRAHG